MLILTSMREEMIFLFSDPLNELEFVFWMFNLNVLSVSMTVIDVSSIFVSEVSMVFFIRFFDCVDLIVYVFETIMVFFLFIELMFSTRITKNVLSKYKI